MRWPRKKTWIVLVLLAGAGWMAYVAGFYFWGQYQFNATQAALDRRDFQKADAHLKKLLGAWPKDVSFRLLLAQTARRRGDFETAAEQLRLCRHKNDFKEPLALEHMLLRVQQYGDLSEADRLLAFCTEYPTKPETPLVLEAYLEGSVTALKSISAASTPDAHLEGGAMKPYLVRMFQAVELWLQYRPSQPDQVQGLVWRGLAHAFANDNAKGIEDMRRALEMDPDHFEARLHLALFIAQAAPAEAVDHLANLRRRFPARNDVALALATMQRTVGQVDVARKILDEVLATDPNFVAALLERGNLALETGQPAEAERPLRQAVVLQPNTPAVNLALSRCLRQLGHEADAKRYHDRYLELDPARKRQPDGAAQKYKSAPRKE